MGLLNSKKNEKDVLNIYLFGASEDFEEKAINNAKYISINLIYLIG